MTCKGGAPVDEFFPNRDRYEVYTEAGKNYATTLNQSNIGNNNNKFYILQILKSDAHFKDIIFFTRWGRVGVPGQQAAIPCGDFGTASYRYHKKLREKLNGGYREV